MKEINSTTNEWVKLLKSLRQKKYRDRHGLYIVEGETAIREALRARQPLHSVWVCNKESGLAEEAQKQTEVVLVPYRLIEQISDTKTPPKEIACLHKEEQKTGVDGRFFVALDGVGDPKNLGTIIRTADAMGADGVWVSPDSADVYGPKAQRAAMGSSFHLPVEVCGLTERLAEFRQAGGHVVCGSLDGSGTLREVYAKAAVVIGNEARGISDAVREVADELYKIELYGQAESLNAGVAAGILLYEMRNRMKG